MAKSLVIVESPAKAKTIGRYLGRGYTVKASVGHVLDLPKKKMGVDIEQDFAITLEEIPGKTKVIHELRKAAEKADTVYLAADPDREGEAISAHLRQILLGNGPVPTEEKKASAARSKKQGVKKKAAKKKKTARKAARKRPKPVVAGKNIYRVTMNEITKRGVAEAFENPRSIDWNLVNAQQTRRVLDRLVGYKISPILWDKVKRGLSAGRVQTVALGMVVERERAIRKFKQEEYWTIAVNLAASQPPAFDAKVAEHQGEKLKVADGETAEQHKSALERASYRVTSIRKKERRRNPAPPFITSTLQQESSRKLRFSVKRTMALAQRLYEGIDVGGDEGLVGLITYMRTDSTRVSQQAIEEVRRFLPEQYGPTYLPEKPRFFRSKKGAQDAHEAIRPTSVLHTPEAMRPYLKEDEFKLYSLVWKRFVASQMEPAVFDQTTVEIEAGDYKLRATGSVLKFDGFLRVYEIGQEEISKSDDGNEEEGSSRLPEMAEGEGLKRQQVKPEQHFTQPPPRFTEAALVKELEQDGIGRPSTYASILSTIQDRNYVEKIQGKFYPTQLGEIIHDELVKSFGDIFDVAYTARMEGELDEIEEGQMEWTDALNEFYEKFKVDLEKADGQMLNYKAGQPTEETCERCGKQMLLRMGRNGLFLACSGYPDCTNTREPKYERPFADIAEHHEGEPEICDNCGREMVVKRGRFGQFWACSGYPDCKTAKPIHAKGQPSAPQPTGEKCPECGNELVKRTGRFGPFVACSGFPKCKYVKQNTLGIACPECGTGELAERRGGRRGNVFYGCTRYPECKFTVNHRPVADSCPDCKAPLTYEKRNKKGTFRYCRAEGCEFEEEIAAQEEPAHASAD